MNDAKQLELLKKKLINNSGELLNRINAVFIINREYLNLATLLKGDCEECNILWSGVLIDIATDKDFLLSTIDSIVDIEDVNYIIVFPLPDNLKSYESDIIKKIPHEKLIYNNVDRIEILRKICS